MIADFRCCRVASIARNQGAGRPERGGRRSPSCRRPVLMMFLGVTSLRRPGGCWRRSSGCGWPRPRPAPAAICPTVLGAVNSGTIPARRHVSHDYLQKRIETTEGAEATEDRLVPGSLAILLYGSMRLCNSSTGYAVGVDFVRGDLQAGADDWAAFNSVWVAWRAPPGRRRAPRPVAARRRSAGSRHQCAHQQMLAVGRHQHGLPNRNMRSSRQSLAKLPWRRAARYLLPGGRQAWPRNARSEEGVGGRGESGQNAAVGTGDAWPGVALHHHLAGSHGRRRQRPRRRGRQGGRGS